MDKLIGYNKLYIIAEIGMNHDGSFGNALRLIEEAKKAGVNAVKFQLHISQEETLPNAPTPPYFTQENRFEYFDRTAFSCEEWSKLKKYAHSLKLNFIVSPFSIKAAQILRKIKVDAYKIASGEVTNIPLLEYINKTKIPVLLSSGMSNWQELNDATQTLNNNLKVIFQCSSQYPCLPESVGLNIITELKNRYPEKLIGFSDHTLDNSSSIAAYIFGARVFEKHFTLSKKMYGPDAKFSLEPVEMKQYVNGLNFIAKAMDNPVNKNDLKKYSKMKYIFEKSIVAARNLPQGHLITFKDLAFKKPGDGIPARYYKKIIGKKTKKQINKNEKISFSSLCD